MASNFTTGVPEIDRLTGNKIGNGSFLLLSGNDDEGIAAFSAEIEKSNGRTADKENIEKNGCMFLKITPENRHCWKEICSRTFENKTMQTKKTTKINQTENQNNQEAVAEKSLKMIIFIDTLSELFQNEKQTEKKNEKQKEEKNEKQNENSAQDRNDEDSARYENDEEEEYRIFSFVKEIKNGINDQ